MKKFITLIISLCSIPVLALDIASCSNPSGKSYYAEIGLLSAKESGWTDDKINGGIIKLTKIGENEYDILYVDIRKEIISARQDGALIMPLSRGANSFSVLAVYTGKTAEVYTFLKTKSGKLEYIHTLSRAGDGVLITKASLMRGDCEYINFGSL